MGRAPSAFHRMGVFLTTPRLEQQWAGYDLVERTDSLAGRCKPKPLTCAHGEIHFSTRSWLETFRLRFARTKHKRGNQTCSNQAGLESPTVTKILFYLRKPEAPVTEELTKVVIEAYNQGCGGIGKAARK